MRGGGEEKKGERANGGGEDRVGEEYSVLEIKTSRWKGASRGGEKGRNNKWGEKKKKP